VWEREFKTAFEAPRSIGTSTKAVNPSRFILRFAVAPESSDRRLVEQTQKRSSEQRKIEQKKYLIEVVQ
jgi:hypothetical protein